MPENEAIEIPEPTKDVSKSIKAIGKDTVHKICSGQVVLSLAIAVKELVENSIDAGAKLIEVKLKDQGLESVEVSDNGIGVEECNLEGMTAKYHTSKLREFDDLQSIETFGFRGEALSSLCALSDMVIITRHSSSQVAVRLELDNVGKFKKKVPCARGVGTTVILSNLFSTLPVRRRDFTKNVKKELAKMCHILQAYCMVTKGVRIICTNQTPKGARNTLMSTNGSEVILDNIRSIFGSKQMAELIEMKPPVVDDRKLTCDDFAELNDPNSSSTLTSNDIDHLNQAPFKFEGWISSCSHGSGRSSKDRQFFYVNSRPCDPKNIAKAVNDIYRRYNVQQFPFVFLNVLLVRSDVDVNLTPDKRQLLVNNEKILLLAIKKSLVNTFGNIPSTFKFQNTFINSFGSSDSKNVDSGEEETIVKPNSEKFQQVLSQWKNTGDTRGPPDEIKNTKRKPTDEIAVRSMKMRKIQEYLSQGSSDAGGSDQNSESFASYKSDSEPDDAEMSFQLDKAKIQSKEFDLMVQSPARPSESVTTAESPSTPPNQTSFVHKVVCKTVSKQPKDAPLQIEEDFSSKKESGSESVQKPALPTEEPDSDVARSPSRPYVLDSSDSENEPAHISDEITTSIEEIRKLVLDEMQLKRSNTRQRKLDRLRFKTEINPTKNKNAEEELAKEISKDMFSKMDIIGQFNLGFIIVKLDQDLFIVDQHASDEKFNFEDLQKTTVLQNQMLAVPQRLEMTAVNEMILLDNLNVFLSNGFKFEIDENAPSTRKIKLIAKPYSKNWEFGKEDIDELVFMLQDAPQDTMCRPSRIRAMFASRACRKSVMVGTALNKRQMKRLITQMGEIEHPWNCPHGRPTMRHLINLAMLDDDDEQ